MNNKSRNNKNELISLLLIIASISIATTGIIIHRQTTPKTTSEERPIELSYPNPFDSILIEGKAAYVLDINSGRVLFKKNAEKPLPLASITKVMTAFVAAQELPTTKVVAIDDKALQTEGDAGLKIRERWKLSDLIDFTLIESANDGAAAVAEAISPSGNFSSEMNKKAREIGMQHSTFYNETGLDVSSEKAGAYGSAEDVAKLFNYILKNNPELLDATQYDELTVQSLDGVSHTAQNTNTVTGKIPNLIASKTGYTLLAGGNLAVAFDAGINRPVVVVVLGSSQEGRFNDVVKLASTTLAYLSIAEK